MGDLPDYTVENRRHWDAIADDWVTLGERAWAAAEPTWGAFGVPSWSRSKPSSSTRASPFDVDPFADPLARIVPTSRPTTGSRQANGM